MPDANEILVSIIVPVLNKERTLHRCVTALQAQTHSNIEILIIDDHSSDQSAKIAHKLSKTDSRIRLHELSDNVGSYRARIIGSRNVKGQCVAFCDADDTMEPRAIELMLEAMLRHDVDLVQMRYRRRLKGLGVKYLEQWNPELADRRIEGDDLRSLASYVGMDSYIYPSCWSKLYRTNLLRSCEMVDFNQFWGDDQIFNIQYLRNCRSMAFIDYVGYCYYWCGDTSSNYKFSFLSQYKNVYSLKRLMGQSEEYINAEIIMLLRYHVRQLLTELSWTREAVLKVIREELNDPLWRQAGLKLSAEQLVDNECDSVQKAPVKYLVKKLLK